MTALPSNFPPHLYVGELGRLVRVVGIFASPDEANAAMEADDSLSLIASFGEGRHCLLAKHDDRGAPMAAPAVREELARVTAERAELHDKLAQVRASLLAVLSLDARLDNRFDLRRQAEPPNGDDYNDVLQQLSLGGVDWKSTHPLWHPLPLGTLVLSRDGEWDEGDDGEERHTGPEAVGYITSADDYEHQGWTYGVVFFNGTVVNIEARELADSGKYLVAQCDAFKD